jgi:glutathione S-transferase
MIQLYYHPGNASLAPHMLLEEIGAPFELVFVDRANAAHKSPEYLKLNPNGQIPVLVDGSFVLYEAAAICLHLADQHPDAKLAPPLGTPERAHFYQWLFWCTNTLQAMLKHYFYGERMVEDGDAAAAAQVKKRAEVQVGPMLDQLDQQLASHGGPWLLGKSFSAVDPYALMLAAGRATSRAPRAACRKSRPICSACSSGPRCSAHSRPRSCHRRWCESAAADDQSTTPTLSTLRAGSPRRANCAMATPISVTAAPISLIAP